MVQELIPAQLWLRPRLQPYGQQGRIFLVFRRHLEKVAAALSVVSTLASGTLPIRRASAGGSPVTMPGNVPGVRGAVHGKDYVAVVTDSFAAVMAGLDRVDATWDDSKALNISTRAAATGGGKVGRGFALTECFHSFVGQVADVEVSGDTIRVRKVFAVVDCGFAIDPPNVMAQVRSAINWP
jgi:hypothetical protein